MSDTELEAAPEVDEKSLATLPSDFDDGLEDFDSSDMVMPRIKIDHQEGKFVDTLTSEAFDNVEVVLLGLVKQRIMWDEDVDEGDGPLCKSVDAKLGNPRKDFPWEASGFAKTSEPLPCESCNFTKWANNKPPACSEQYTFPLMMAVDGSFRAPAILTLQRSGIKPAKSYLTSFKRSKMPVFTAVTRLKLDMRKKGSVTYSVPIIERVGEADPDMFRFFAEQYRSIREYLHSMEESDAEDAEATTTATIDNTAEGKDEDLPF